MNLRIIREGIRIGTHGLVTKVLGPRRYIGDAESICRHIVNACWDEGKGFYRMSLHNYPVFYARDFGMCIDSLLAIGKRDRVRKTLAWALESYEANGRIMLVVNRAGRPFNFPDVECPDGYAFLLHSLWALNDRKLIDEYKGFLEQEIARFVDAVVDRKTGLCKRGVHLGGMRDYAIRDSSCYDNVMLAAIKKYSERLKLKNPLKKYDYEKLLLENFWTGSYFKDDMMNAEPTGDTNIAPLWFGIFPQKKEKALLKSIMAMIKRQKLDKPFVMRYEPHENASAKMIWLDHLAGGWERDTVWLFLGNMLLQVLARHDEKEAKRYLDGHRKLIQREQNYPEVLDKDGRPHKGPFFHADDSMLWACNFLALSRELK